MIQKSSEIALPAYWSKILSTIYEIASQKSTHLPIFRTRRQGRVLLIEADATLRQTLKFLLESQGYRVDIATDTAIAYRKSAFKGFAFILFNRCMEGAAEGDLCRQIRVVNKATTLFFYNTQEHENARDINFEANIYQYDAQSIRTNAMLSAIFLHLQKEKCRLSVTEKFSNS